MDRARFHPRFTVLGALLACAGLIPSVAADETSRALMNEIVAARIPREDAIATASVAYQVRTPETQWRTGRWATAPNGDVHAIGPLPPHPLFDAAELWPVMQMTHEVRQSVTERIWVRADAGAGLTEVALEPGALTIIERLAGHPLVYDLVVDRWLESDEEIQVRAVDYAGEPAAYVRTKYGNEAWLLRNYDWAVAEMREWNHGWVVRASGFDRIPSINGAAPQRLQWFFEGALVLEIQLDHWTGQTADAVYQRSVDVGDGVIHVADRRVSPAAMLEVPDVAALEAYLRDGTVPPQPENLADPDIAERVVFVIDSTAAREVFSLNDMPYMSFGIVEDADEHFGYLAASDPRMDPFSPTQVGDVILAVDGEEWRPETQADIGWLLGRFTWMALWDKPFTVTLLRDGQLIEYEIVWSHEQLLAEG